MEKLKKFFLKFILSIIAIIGVILLLVFGAAYIKKEKLYKATPISEKVKTIEEKDTYIKLNSISDDFLTAIVCIEDHRFYKHCGFDPISFARATLVNLKSQKFSQGGSTISQQLAKRLYLNADKSIFRKVTELLISFDLEKFLDKDKILELYINSVYYGRSSTGIYEASINYFNKTPNLLTKNEAAFLAGLPQAPSVYQSNEKLATQRMNEVLNAITKYSEKIK